MMTNPNKHSVHTCNHIKAKYSTQVQVQSEKSNNISDEKFNLIFLKTNIINNPEEVIFLILHTN